MSVLVYQMIGCGPITFREYIHPGSKCPDSLIDYKFAFSPDPDFCAVLGSEHSGEQVRTQSGPRKLSD